jgi:hypothetical protein
VCKLVSTCGPADTGGVRICERDSEPEWSYGVHIDVYRQDPTYDDMMTHNVKWAQPVKSSDPTALGQIIC